jgi:hypothetical protein
LLSREQILRNQAKAVALLLVIASLLGIAEGVVASPDNQKAFWSIPTNLFAVYNFLVLGIGGVFLARAVLFNLGLVPNFVVKGRGFLRGARVGLIRTLANAAIFPLLQDTWSQALQVLNSKPPNTPAYVIITGIFPRYDWEGIRYPGIGEVFGRATPPFNFPFWYYIWIAGLVSYFAIDVVRLYGVDIGNVGEELFSRLIPERFVGVFCKSFLGRAYLHLRGYAKISFQAVG